MEDKHYMFIITLLITALGFFAGYFIGMEQSADEYAMLMYQSQQKNGWLDVNGELYKCKNYGAVEDMYKKLDVLKGDLK